MAFSHLSCFQERQSRYGDITDSFFGLFKDILNQSTGIGYSCQKTLIYRVIPKHLNECLRKQAGAKGKFMPKAKDSAKTKETVSSEKVTPKKFNT